MSYMEQFTTDELIQLKRIAVETRDMKAYKAVVEEMNKRSKYDE